MVDANPACCKNCEVSRASLLVGARIKTRNSLTPGEASVPGFAAAAGETFTTIKHLIAENPDGQTTALPLVHPVTHAVASRVECHPYPPTLREWFARGSRCAS